jgi:hypothetical protein
MVIQLLKILKNVTSKTPDSSYLDSLEILFPEIGFTKLNKNILKIISKALTFKENTLYKLKDEKFRSRVACL